MLAPGERGVPPRRAAVGPGSIQLVRRWPGFLDVLFFYGALPFRVRRLVRRFRPGAVIAESPYIGFFVLIAMSTRRRDRPSIVVETHGDWRTATRHGGSRLRVLSPRSPTGRRGTHFAMRTRCGRSLRSPRSWRVARRVCRRSSRSRPTSISVPSRGGQRRHSRRGRRSCSSACSSAPRESRARRRLAAGCRTCSGRAARARRTRRAPGRRRWTSGQLPRARGARRADPTSAVAERMDAATCLVLPSRSEGLGRVILEAFARGRAVVATRVGGIPDLVEHDVNGLLVRARQRTALVDALHKSSPRTGSRLGSAPPRTRRLSPSSGRPTITRRACALWWIGPCRKLAADAPDLRDAVRGLGRPDSGRTVAKLRALAERCEELVVITDRIGAHDLPANCTLRTFGAPTKLGRGLRYMRALAPLLLSRKRRPDA